MNVRRTDEEGRRYGKSCDCETGMALHSGVHPTSCALCKGLIE